MRITQKQTLLLILLLFAVLLSLRLTKPFDNALSWDTKGYYLYLPAAFIYDDPGIRNLEWVEDIQQRYGTTATLYFLNRQEFGDHVIKYTGGMAMLYAPFFLVGHAVAVLLPEVLADGFSLPYQVALSLGMFVYVFLALWFWRLLLHRYFKPLTVLLTLFLVVAGTNLLHQFAFAGLMAHTPLVFLFALLLWGTVRFYDNLSREPERRLAAFGRPFSLPGPAGMRWWVLCGLVAGLISLIRPTEAVAVVLVFLWGTGSAKDLKKRLAFFLRRPAWLLLFFGTMFLMVLPQLVYWKGLTGQWLYYSYDNAGEGLDLLYPHTWKFLFSFRKGWLVYTPLMVFALAGFFTLYRKDRGLFFPVAVFFLLSLYLMSSWTTWWYAGGCFSSRAIISAYPALSLPLASLLEWLQKQGRARRFALWLVMGLLILLNLFQTWQFHRGIITLETMTRAYYFRTFLKTSVKAEDRELLLVTRSLTAIEALTDEQAYESRELFRMDLRPETYPDHAFTDTLPGPAGLPAMVLDTLRPFSPSFQSAYRDLTGRDHAWVRIEARVYVPAAYEGPDPLLVATFSHKGGNYKYRSSENHKIELEAGGWNTIRFDYMTPEVRRRSDLLYIYVWHRGRQPVYLGSLSAVLYEPMLP
jgi:hypothetical protein